MPTIKPRRITPENFAPFGRVVTAPAHEPTASGPTFKFWSDIASYHVDGETEIGLCTVYRQDRDVVDWMEQHVRTPEILIPIDAPFVLPVMKDGNVQAFIVNPGEAAVIGDGEWHSACIPAGRMEMRYFVIFRRGTPAQDVTKQDIQPLEIERI